MEAELAKKLGIKHKKIGIAGKLGFLSLAELLQFIGSNGGTGTLHVKSPYLPNAGIVYFLDGKIVHAESPPSLTGLDAIYSLFGWIEGEFQFFQEKVAKKKTINRNRMEIILDGLRMLDDGQIPKIGKSYANGNNQELESGKVNDGAELTYPLITGPNVDYNYVLTEEEFFEGQQIVRENTHGSWVWVILDGIVSIQKETPRGPMKILNIGRGVFIGNIDSFSFQQSVRTATAVAAEHVQLGVLDVQLLTKEYTTKSNEYQMLVQSLDRRLRQVTDQAAAIYLKKSKGLDFVKGQKLYIKQGDSNKDTLYRIKKGQAFIVHRTKWGYIPLAHLKQNDFIGRIPFIKHEINHEPNFAYVFASEDLTLAKVNIEALAEQHEMISDIFKNMIESLAICITETTRVAKNFQKAVVEKD